MRTAAKGALATLAVFTAFFAAALLGNAGEITQVNATTWLLAAALPSLVITIVVRGYAVVRARMRGSRQQTLIEGW